MTNPPSQKLFGHMPLHLGSEACAALARGASQALGWECETCTRGMWIMWWPPTLVLNQISTRWHHRGAVSLRDSLIRRGPPRISGEFSRDQFVSCSGMLSLTPRYPIVTPSWRLRSTCRLLTLPLGLEGLRPTQFLTMIANVRNEYSLIIY